MGVDLMISWEKGGVVCTIPAAPAVCWWFALARRRFASVCVLEGVIAPETKLP